MRKPTDRSQDNHHGHEQQGLGNGILGEEFIQLVRRAPDFADGGDAQSVVGDHGSHGDVGQRGRVDSENRGAAEAGNHDGRDEIRQAQHGLATHDVGEIRDGALDLNRRRCGWRSSEFPERCSRLEFAFCDSG